MTPIFAPNRAQIPYDPNPPAEVLFARIKAIHNAIAENRVAMALRLYMSLVGQANIVDAAAHLPITPQLFDAACKQMAAHGDGRYYDADTGRPIVA